MMNESWRDRISKGENHITAKLNDKKVLKIKRLINKGLSNADIAKIFGVGPTTISSIRTKKRWRHVKLKEEQ